MLAPAPFDSWHSEMLQVLRKLQRASTRYFRWPNPGPCNATRPHRFLTRAVWLFALCCTTHTW